MMIETELVVMIEQELRAFDRGQYEFCNSARKRLEKVIQEAFELGYQQGFDDGQHSILLSRAYR